MQDRKTIVNREASVITKRYGREKTLLAMH